ncbi:hypothetical protein Taro_042014 [Colocasia esculenta]|uniref:ALBINO3-like protein 2, chloroplastic n=1 Tax=Colocasia esculenta TaxID=4460 RepID=A0A843WHB5_COLES|nr:hypothetical protein [Colocasia esculenta]
MGATHLLCHLRRLRSSPAAVLFYTFQNPRTFPLRCGGAFCLHGGGHLPAAPPGDHVPFLEGRRALSSWAKSASPGFAEDGAAGEGEVVSVGGADLSVPAFDGGEDSIWYAPVRVVISLLDGYHEAIGLPWWITIATSTLALRVLLLPVLLVQLKKAQKMSQLFPKLPPPLPPPFSGKSFKEQFLLFRKKRLELGCPSYLWNFAFVSVQFPCFLTWMTGIRRMSLDSHPGFDCGGVLWFQNLTEFPQGVMGAIFPLLVAGLHFVNVQISFQSVKLKEMPGIFGLLARYYKLYLDILSFPLLLVGFNIPQVDSYSFPWFSHLNQGKKEEGIEHLKRIAQLKEPESPADRACYYSGLVLLGSTLFNEGQKSEAARYLRMAAAYDPSVNVYVKQCEEE